MKKIILLLLLLNYSISYSQKYTSWGIKAGYVKSQIIHDNYKGFNKQGFDFGFFSQLQLSNKLNLQMEILFINKGCADKRNKNYSYKAYSYFNILYYVEIPILFQYNYKKIYLEGGPALALLVWSLDNESTNAGYLSASPAFMETSFNIGFGYLYNKRLNFSLRYNNSIIPIRTIPTSQYNSVFSLSLLYKLGLRKEAIEK